MDLSSGSSSNRRNRGYGNRRVCACQLPAKIFTAWTDKNPGRRFYGCELYKEGENNHCSYFAWLDEEEVKGWAKRASIQARDEIREKKKQINELTATVNDLTATVNALRMELEQQKVEKPGSREMVVYRPTELPH
ncbi:uncharacterized protein LOC130511391 [Raphanus sativus]|uniref:Uncharacterized protein LOC130507812 n=1 Tax=Raphanus sativus TaxID=3726 RepID=A0A9W3D3W3_RAPSA|nr:uncharacterized protein LOC130507812 [Raphanus sativus]XP_056864335.1 uncharacterized protein LOC130511391 [Raphanus sativus]